MSPAGTPRALKKQGREQLKNAQALSCREYAADKVASWQQDDMQQNHS